MNMLDPAVRDAIRAAVHEAMAEAMKKMMGQALAAGPPKPPPMQAPPLAPPPLPSAVDEDAVPVAAAMQTGPHRAGQYAHGDLPLDFVVPNVLPMNRSRGGGGRTLYFLPHGAPPDTVIGDPANFRAPGAPPVAAVPAAPPAQKPAGG